jgi:hypothetical protein
MRKILIIILLLSKTALFAQIQYESLTSLLLIVFHDADTICQGTGFIIKPKNNCYLVTNYHVLTNKNPYTGTWADEKKQLSPNRIEIWYHSKTSPSINKKYEVLIRSGKELFMYKTENSKVMDIGILPLTDTVGDIRIFPLKYDEKIQGLKSQLSLSENKMKVTEQVFSIGFPYGAIFDNYPLWKKGTIATEPISDYNGYPIIAADGIWLPGMSGSPVYQITNSINIDEGQINSNQPYKIFVGVQSMTNFGLGISFFYKAKYLIPWFNSLE